MEDLEDKAARRDGITVPLFHNDKGRNLLWSAGPGAPDDLRDRHLSGTASTATARRPRRLTDYGFLRDGTSFNPPRPGVGNRPFFFAEFQGGAFDPWGGPGYDSCRAADRRTGVRADCSTSKNIANRFTAQNFYMTYGGTNWGWLAEPRGLHVLRLRRRDQRDAAARPPKVPVAQAARAPGRDGARPPKTDDLGEVTRVEPGDPGLTKDATPTRGRTSTSSATPATGRRRPTTRRRSASRLPDGTCRVGAGQRPRTSRSWPPATTSTRQRLVYSTSRDLRRTCAAGRRTWRCCTAARRERRDGAALPQPAAREGAAPATSASRWDAARGDLRLSYVHDGLARGADQRRRAAAADRCCWPTATRRRRSGGSTARAGPVLVRGAYSCAAPVARLGAGAERRHRERGRGRGLRPARARVGDLERPAAARARGPRSGSLLADRWAGRGRSAAGARRLAVLAPEAPEVAAGLRRLRLDGGRQDHDEQPDEARRRLPVLYADDYGFHYGDVWYRGHFTAAGADDGAGADRRHGARGRLAGVGRRAHLGEGAHRHRQRQPELERDVRAAGRRLRRAQRNVISVLVRNMGHNEDGGEQRRPEGAAADCCPLPSSARTRRRAGASRASAGGEALVDRVRGPQNNGGLYGERSGWSLPGFDDRRWAERVAAAPPSPRPGVVVVPHTGQARPAARPGRARRPDASPTTRSRPLPRADLRQRLERRAVRQRRRPAARLRPAAGDPAPPGDEHDRSGGVVRRRGDGAGLGAVDLVALGNTATSLRVHDVYSPG